MTYSWQKMAEEDYAAFVQLTGAKVIRTGGMHWCEVRAFFYRPLLQFEEFHPATIIAPPFARLGGVQYAVAPEDEANCFLNRLVFPNTPDYSLAALGKNPKRQVKLAAKEFTIRRIADVDEFKTKAFPAYLSFYRRTRYKVGAQRREPAHFSRWAGALFQLPQVLILGGYRNDELGGVSLSFVVGSTLVYATFFCNDESLRLYLSDLMLHTVRESAAACPQIKEVFTGMYKGGGGLDDFYLHRGARLVRQRADIRINPLARAFLQYCLPGQYSHLLGTLSREQTERLAAGGHTTAGEGNPGAARGPG